MNHFGLLKPLLLQNDSKIVLLVMDGLGGLPREAGGLTELETARTPNMDALAAQGQLGLSVPIAVGVAPGSGPAHLSLFGYDPLEFIIGRGALEALGIGFHLTERDVAARGNFCTLDAAGNVADRRAGRIKDDANQRLCAILSQITVDGAELIVKPVKEHRFVLILRGDGLSGDLSETDPGMLGKPPLVVTAESPAAARTAQIANRFIAQARELLKDEHPANMVLLRGFAKHPGFPTFDQVYGLKASAVAVYPMYRGLASLLGMRVLETGPNVADEFNVVARHWKDHDFFFVHVKKTDSMGEDGNFDGKVHVIEEVDSALPILTALKPDALLITGDHSTPATYKSHSWHPVPTLLWSKWCRGEGAVEFGERACLHGAWGTFHATSIMPELLGHAGKLARYGA